MSAEIRYDLRDRGRAAGASMGPRSDERGNAAQPNVRVLSAARLQWGRAQMSAEIRVPPYRVTAPVELQWGRAQMSAEINQLIALSALSPRFNGAALR